MPRMKHILPTAIYAYPKNEFFPPKNDVFDKINNFDPSNWVTG